MAKKKVVIYTDGAARGNPGPAGWGAVFISPGKEIEIGGRVEHATNNQMELQAAIEALKYLKSNMSKTVFDKIEIITDSKYVVLGITEWIGNWIEKGWRGANKKRVMNRELWEELHELNREVKPKWSYVEGHSNHPQNNRADEIATSFADNEPVKLVNLPG